MRRRVAGTRPRVIHGVLITTRHALNSYTEAIQAMIDAKSSGEAFNITFRRAPWKTGTLWKVDVERHTRSMPSGPTRRLWLVV